MDEFELFEVGWWSDDNLCWWIPATLAVRGGGSVAYWWCEASSMSTEAGWWSAAAEIGILRNVSGAKGLVDTRRGGSGDAASANGGRREMSRDGQVKAKAQIFVLKLGDECVDVRCWRIGWYRHDG